jgi:hypothetical protein
MTNLINKAVEVKKEVSIKNDTSKEKIKGVEKVEFSPNETSIKTWAMVQEVAKGEIQANGKMANIFKNFMQLYEDEQMDISNYFEKTANDKSLISMFFDVHNERKTLISKDFAVFTDKVLIPSLHQNLDNFVDNFEYEYKALIQVAPVVMFGLANRQYIDLEKMIFKAENPKIPNQVILDWAIFRTDHLENSVADKREKAFLENLNKKLFLQAEMGKPYYAFFRGNKGLIEIAKAYFTPLKNHADNVISAEVSPFTSELRKITHEKTGALGRNLVLTKVSENEPTSSPVHKRQNNEVDACFDTIDLSINLIANTQSKYAQAKLLEIYQLVIAKLTSDNFNLQFPKVKLHKVEFNPRVKNTPIDVLNGGDLIKYVSNL